MLITNPLAKTGNSAVAGAEFHEFVAVTRVGFEVDYCAVVLNGPAGWYIRASKGEVVTLNAATSTLLALAIAGHEATVIPDTLLDERVGHQSEGIRFFAAWPVVAATGERLGFFVLADPGRKTFRNSELHHMSGITGAIANTLNAEKEMRYAATVQRALLPRNTDPLPGYQVAGCCVPTASVGGDLYDWYPIPEGLALTLGDVMGKGVGAGIIAARVGAVLKSAAKELSVSTAVNLASETLGDELGDAGSFFTLFHARIEAATGRVAYADAGHGLSLIIRDGGASFRLASNDFPVGMTPQHTWTSQVATLRPGDMLVSVSDGLLDLYDGTLRSLDHVTALARSSPSPDEFVRKIENLASVASAPDDVTAIAIKRR